MPCDWVRPTNFNEYNKVEIRNDVWIGEFVSIKCGVKICDGAIIATKAVVTKDVESFSIYTGNPSKKIRIRFDSEDELMEYKRLYKLEYK